jgi:hypothetical protein
MWKIFISGFGLIVVYMVVMTSAGKKCKKIEKKAAIDESWVCCVFIWRTFTKLRLPVFKESSLNFETCSIVELEVK